LAVPVASLICLVGDVLAGVGEVFAHEGIVKAEFVGENDGLTIFLQGLRPIPMHGMHRHGEITQSHLLSAFACATLQKEKVL
jgi:hypothetical protein